MGVVYARVRSRSRAARRAQGAAHADAGDDARARLLREARAMARLTHPNVVTVHEVGTAAGRDYVAMELVEGEHARRVAARGAAARARSSRRSRRRARARRRARRRSRAPRLQAAQRAAQRDGRIVVTDFGLARADLLGGEPPTRPRRRSPMRPLEEPRRRATCAPDCPSARPNARAAIAARRDQILMLRHRTGPPSTSPMSPPRVAVAAAGRGRPRGRRHRRVAVATAGRARREDAVGAAAHRLGARI